MFAGRDEDRKQVFSSMAPFVAMFPRLISVVCYEEVGVVGEGVEGEGLLGWQVTLCDEGNRPYMERGGGQATGGGSPTAEA